MTDAFEILGIEPRLVIDEEALRAAFRDSGKELHPDAGGGEQEFDALQEAFEVLSSPARRLRHFLELRGFAVESRGTVDASLMDLFAGIGGVTQQAEALIRRRNGVKSALGLAMLEGETQHCRESVEAAIRTVDDAITCECAGFSEIEQSGGIDKNAVSMKVRNLTFLEKWRTGLRSVFARLI